MNRLDLISYAQSFVSLLLRSGIKESEINEIVLFGSVARGEFDRESDVDLFIDVVNDKDAEKVEAKANKELRLFHNSKASEIWRHAGIENEISIKVGKMEKWELERSIISDGITLYGRYKKLPKKLKHFDLFSFEPIESVTKRNSVIRELFGRKEGKYEKEGLVTRFGGRILSPRNFIVPAERSQEVIKVLNQKKVNYTVNEIYSDIF